MQRVESPQHLLYPPCQDRHWPRLLSLSLSSSSDSSAFASDLGWQEGQELICVVFLKLQEKLYRIYVDEIQKKNKFWTGVLNNNNQATWQENPAGLQHDLVTPQLPWKSSERHDTRTSLVVGRNGACPLTIPPVSSSWQCTRLLHCLVVAVPGWTLEDTQ